MSQKRHSFDTNTAQAALQQFGTFECERFRNRIFEEFSLFRPCLKREYLRIANQQSYVEANRRLLKRSEELKRSDLNLTEPESTLKLFANDISALCINYKTELDDKKALEKCLALVKKYGLTLPSNLPSSSILKRLEDKNWWYRRIRKLRDRVLSEIERDIGVVSQHNDIYVSTRALKNQRYKKEKQQEFLESRTLTNCDNETLNLAECAASNISNPEIRRAELMVRIKGFEQVAQVCNHKALFFTITTPSRMHRVLRKSGKLNAKFDGTTPKDAQDYLQQLWARARAELHRNEIQPYGFRVVEPHHDGTPHWHLLLFVEESKAEALNQILRQYALSDTPNEKGAAKRRITVEEIDSTKGSATGYIAKYIAKNVDGKHIEKDSYGKEAQSSAERITTWASNNNIRQFQQIGGPSVTVWRELRKLKSPMTSQIGESARAAADAGDWAAFVFAMGGITIKASDRPISPFYEHIEAVDINTGEIHTLDKNKYGETRSKPIRGLVCDGQPVPTRHYVWHPYLQLRPLARESIGTEMGSFDQLGAIASEASGTWTCVNNCTEEVTTL